MNQDQDGSSEKPSDREQNAQPKTTRNGRSQDVEERRESNRTSMTNLAEKRSRECNRDQITIGTREGANHSSERTHSIVASPRVPFTSKGAKFESKRRAKKSFHERAKSAYQAPYQLGQRHLDRARAIYYGRTKKNSVRNSLKKNPVEAKRSMLHCKGVLDLVESLEYQYSLLWVLHVFHRF